MLEFNLYVTLPLGVIVLGLLLHIRSLRKQMSNIVSSKRLYYDAIEDKWKQL